jgi:nucleotide-binding universal stress UspA family protein
MSWFSNRKILVPIDFSELSWTCVDAALEMADQSNQITVLHVVEPMPAYDITARYGDEIDKKHALKSRESLEQHLADAKYAGIKIEVVIDDPPHGIADFAEKMEVDLIVMPSHGRTGIKRLLIGSVAERVVRLAHCPVLVMRS